MITNFSFDGVTVKTSNKEILLTPLVKPFFVSREGIMLNRIVLTFKDIVKLK